MNRKRHPSFSAFVYSFLASVVVLTAGLPGNARAECSDEARKEIYRLNQQAMEAYQNMDFDEARSLLRKAFKQAEGNDCSLDSIHAMTLMNLGILVGGGLGKKALARKFFIQALRVRPQAPLDESFATPVLKKIYRYARKRLRIVEDPEPWPKVEEADPLPPDQRPPKLPLEHDPVDQAPQGRPLEIACRVGEDVSPQKVLLSYRPYKESTFKTVEMKKNGERWTWKGTIPAKAVWGRSLQYYIHAKTSSEQAVVTSGSLISPHVVEIVSQGGKPDSENPFVRKKAEGEAKGPSKLWVQIGPAFGAGLARGQVEVIDEQGGVAAQTGVPRDKIESPGMAPGSLGVVAELGYFVMDDLLLSLQGRFGYIEMLTKNVEDGAVADFAVLARIRYFFLDMLGGWLKLYAGGGLGFAQIRHVVALDLEQGSYKDTDLSMGIAPSGFGGLTIGNSSLVKGYIETAFLMTIWNDADLFTFHLDFSAGVCFAF
jgi:hypothetical protein